jgi:hypothetical protein
MYSHTIKDEKMETISRTKLEFGLAEVIKSSRYSLRDNGDDEWISDACYFEEVLCTMSVTRTKKLS